MLEIFGCAHSELVALAALVACYAVLCLSVASAGEVAAQLVWRTASVRPPMLVVLVLLGWALVVDQAQRARLRLELLIGPAQPAPPTVTARGAVALLDAVLLCHLLPFLAQVAGSQDVSRWSLAADCLALCCVAAALWAPPSRAHVGGSDAKVDAALSPERAAAHVKYDHSLALQTAHSRDSLARTLWDSFLAPFAPVTFWHVIVADYATSLAKALGDVHVTTCVASTYLFSVRSPMALEHSAWWEEARGPCASSVLNASALALPFSIRLFQCFAVYRLTGEAKNLWNAAKYATAFPLVYAGYLERVAPSEYSRQLFVVAAIAQSSATFGFCSWDVVMDWGLPAKSANGVLFGGWTLSAMRRPKSLVFTETSVCVGYGAVVALNLALRFLWTLAVFGAAPTRGWGMFAFEVAELVRRTVWALFRIEWEQIARQIPSATAPDEPASGLELREPSAVEDEAGTLLSQSSESSAATFSV